MREARIAAALVGPRAADLAIATFIRWGVGMLRADGRSWAEGAVQHPRQRRRAGRAARRRRQQADNKLARRWQWAISLWKNQGSGRRRRRPRAPGTTTNASTGARDAALRGTPAGQPGGRLRRPHRPAAAAAAARRRAREVAGPVRHVLVDEYQDTNAAQYELLKALVANARSSPRWATTTRASTAGAAPIEPQPAVAFPALTVIKLEQNYRSGHHPARRQRGDRAPSCSKLWSEYGDGRPVRMQECDGEGTRRPSARWRSSRRCARRTTAGPSVRGPLPPPTTARRACSSEAAPPATLQR